MPEFAHLHVHTQFSLLDGAAGIKQLTAQAKADGQTALAITDHGNMYGVPQFVIEAQKQNIKPIIGCEFYVAPNSRFDRTKVDPEKERGFYHQIILAKNEEGYHNISKLSSLGFTEGFYYKPRIDKEILKKYSAGLIATTCCLASEVNQNILMKGEEEAEKVFKLYLDIFGDDYYIELQRHGIADQEKCNEVLLRWAKKYNVKTIATNDVHYVNIQDAQAQDILLCLQTGRDMDDPNRMRFENNQFYLKTQTEMNEVFQDIPEAVDYTHEIVSKVETPKLFRDVLMPSYELPPEFTNEDQYLRDLTVKGAKQRYPEIKEEVNQRINHELGVIENMGFAGYFLIVQDFVRAARNQKVWVGPGRGSAAGSIVAFCTGITNIDPIKYNLLFERFLNPDRVSMPDIDIDFDDDGRQDVIDYVVNRYGKDRVAQIITFGTMAAKSSIRDVARVLKLPLPEADKLAKLVPEIPGISLDKAFNDVKELREAKKGKDKVTRETLEFAGVLEGCARHTGIHAAGVIIAPDDLTKYLPICTAKDSDLVVTQYGGKYVEKVGMLKMDFLGLKTLTIIKDAIAIIKGRNKIDIDIDTIPLDDEKTYQLYQKGDTIGTFQFESEGMRQYLKELKPTDIEDLIAMNALYRPGPMDFIPQFIDCKHGRKKTVYPHPLLEDILKNTYGIMVYQEQIMQSAQVMGDFSLSDADILRRAMGKKDLDVMNKKRVSFIDGAEKKGIQKKKAEEVFDIMSKFAEYGFNRSHSAAYSVLAFQTGYLKAHYPAEYMAAVLTNNMQDIKKVTFFIEEAKRQGIPVLGPDVNESYIKFAVNKKGEIRFGLAAIKGLGKQAAESLIHERKASGPFTDIFDLVSRVNLSSVNRRSLESLIKAGAFDSFKGLHRAQYLYVAPNDVVSNLEKIIKTGSQMQSDKNNSQHSLFGDSIDVPVVKPTLPDCEPWSELEKLRLEKEVAGIYFSGHPLDMFHYEMMHFCKINTSQLKELKPLKDKNFSFAGIVTEVKHRLTKTGRPFGTFTIEDYADSHNIALFGENYLKFKHLLEKENFLHITATVKPGWRDNGMLELKILNMQLLSEVGTKLTRKFTLKVDVTALDEGRINNLKKLLKQHKGKVPIRFNLIDKEDKYSVFAGSKTIKVKYDQDLMEALDSTSGLEYSIN